LSNLKFVHLTVSEQLPSNPFARAHAHHTSIIIIIIIIIIIGLVIILIFIIVIITDSAVFLPRNAL